MKTLNLVAAIVISFSSAFAEEPKAPTPTPLPKSGSLGSSLVGGYGGAGAAGQWGGSGNASQEGSPISGSVSRVSEKEWKARIFNNSKDSYSASVELEQFNERGGKIKGDYFSLSLKPGESVERSVSAAGPSRNANLQLRNWKKTSKEAPPAAVAEGTPVTKAPQGNRPDITK